MRVLLWAIDGNQIITGYYIQCVETAKHLRLLGIDAEANFDRHHDLSGYDLVHSFRCPQDVLRRARLAGLPIVQSTIYHRSDYFPMPGSKPRASDWVSRGRMGAVLLRSALRGDYATKCMAITRLSQDFRITCEMCDLLLPNSEMQGQEVTSDLGLTTPYHVVPNGIDPSKYPASYEAPTEKRTTILYTGRFEPHKNQLGLIRAMKGTKHTVNLVGPSHPGHIKYYEQCKKEAQGNIKVLPPVPRQEDLRVLYEAARVHVLPSWFETTGLSSLEAAFCGCNVVSTNRGYAHEYLGEDAWYCDPSSSTSIRQAVEKACAAPQNLRLRQRILDHFTWSHAAAATLEAYHKVLSISPRN